MLRFPTTRRPIAALALLAASALPLPAAAGTSSTTFTVTVTIPTSCTITATTLNFGSYDGANVNATTPLGGTGSVSTTCTPGSVPTIALGAGANASGTQREMKDGAGDLLAYNLYQPSSTTPGAACSAVSSPGTAWGDGTSATTGSTFAATSAPTTAARAYNVCGVIPAGQSKPVNSGSNTAYVDTVTATVSF